MKEDASNAERDIARKSALLMSVTALLVVLLMCRPVCADAETKTFVAYSMKVAQARVEAAVKSGEDFRKKQPDLYYLGGITKPWALVVDSKNGDWILLGERDQKSSVLTLDDWIVALRARFVHPEKDPGVTIDPRLCDECLKAGKKEGCSHFKRQDVRFFGGIENTHFGQVCYEADWLMKRIGLGIEKLPTDKVKSYFDLSVEQAKNAGGTNTRVGSRFWFYPVVSRVNVIGDVVLLEKFQMGVFTEVLYAEIGGKPVENPDKFEHYPSEGFSRSFSENYDAVAESREVLESLCGMSRLAALAKGLTQVREKPSVDFFLKTYGLEKLNTPREAEVLKTESRDVGFQISGGAELMALAMEFKDGNADALKKLVLVARPSPDALNWGFENEMRDGRLAGVSLPPGLADPAGIAQLMSQSRFLLRKKRTDNSIECLTRVIELDPRCAQAYNDRGLAYRMGSNGGKAKKDYLKAIEVDSGLALPMVNLGVLFVREGSLEEAEKHLREAVRIAEWLPGAHNNLGIVLRMRGRLREAAVEYRRAIALDGRDAVHQYNLGLCLLLDGKVDEAVVALRDAVRLSPQALPQARYQLAISLFEQGSETEALDEFEALLRQSRTPRLPETSFTTERDWGTILNSKLGDDADLLKNARIYVAELRRRLGETAKRSD